MQRSGGTAALPGTCHYSIQKNSCIMAKSFSPKHPYIDSKCLKSWERWPTPVISTTANWFVPNLAVVPQRWPINMTEQRQAKRPAAHDQFLIQPMVFKLLASCQAAGHHTISHSFKQVLVCCFGLSLSFWQEFLCSYLYICFVVIFQIAKDAKDCTQECVSEFISFITSEYPF